MDIGSFYLQVCPELSKCQQDSNINSVYNKLIHAVSQAQYIQQLSQDKLIQQINMFSSLISEATQIINKLPKNNNILLQNFQKQQKSMILQLIDKLQETIQKLTSINHQEPSITLNQQETVEITVSALQLNEKPSQNMYQINNILRDIQHTQKITNSAIQQQQENIWRIGDNLDSADQYVEKANQKLVRALKNIKGYWKTLLIIFLFVLFYIAGKALIKKI